MKKRLCLVIIGLLIYSVNCFSINRIDFNIITFANDTPVAKNNWLIGSFAGVRVGSTDTIYFDLSTSDSVDINFLENDFDTDGFIDSTSVEILFLSPEFENRAELTSKGHLIIYKEENYSSYIGYLDYRVKDDSGLYSNTARVYLTIDRVGGLDYENTFGKLRFYSNPANEKLVVAWKDFSTLKNRRVSLIDLNGRVIFNDILQSESMEWNTSKLANGFYYLKWELGTELIKTDKIIIQHP